jgi:hypothetical protein
MKKTSIITAAICAFILIAVTFLTIKEEPCIGKIYLSHAINTDEFSEENLKITDFNSDSSDIYLIIPVKDVEYGEKINVTWLYHKGSEYSVIQQDRIKIKNNGSGKISVYLLKRNNRYYPGDYKVIVDYNNMQSEETSFSVGTD